MLAVRRLTGEQWTKKKAIDRLEATRISLSGLKSFKGKAAVERKLKDQIRFLTVHRADELSALFVKEAESVLIELSKKHKDRAADIEAVIKTCRGELILT